MNVVEGFGFVLVLSGFVIGCRFEPSEDSVSNSPPAFDDTKESTWTLQPGWGLELNAPCSIDFWANDEETGHFYLVRTSEGKSITAPGFPETWRRARRTGKPRAGIHAFVLGEPAIEQAIWFLSHTSSDDWGELPPVLDLESLWVENGMSTKACEREWLRWLRRVEAVMDCRPILKMGSEFANRHIQDTLFNRYPLWLSDWSSELQNVPKIWEETGWTFASAPPLEKGQISPDGGQPILCRATPNFPFVQPSSPAHE